MGHGELWEVTWCSDSEQWWIHWCLWWAASLNPLEERRLAPVFCFNVQDPLLAVSCSGKVDQPTLLVAEWLGVEGGK